MKDNLFRVRVTGILIEDDAILLVKQKISDRRNWSLPGGKLEVGESIAEGITRELFEETGLRIKVENLLYLSELPESNPPLIHITFLLSRISGEIIKPSNEFETTPIYDVQFVPINKLIDYGFNERFVSLIENDFPKKGQYVGHKVNIGLEP